MTLPAILVGVLWVLLAAHLASRVPGPKRLPGPAAVPAIPVQATAPAGPGRARLPWSRGASRRGGSTSTRPALLAGAALLLVHPALAPLPLALLALGSVARERRRRRDDEHALVDQLPDLIDLLRLTTLAGLPVSLAVRTIGGRPGGRAGAAVAEAALVLERGATVAQALEQLRTTGGDPIRPLVDTLADHDRYGTPLGPGLERAAIESRLLRRRRAQEAARRLPVTLLFPLVLTTLPAFVLLTIVPMVMGSFSSLRP